MTNRRGFISFQLAGALAAGAVIIGLGLALKVQSARLDAAQADLAACMTRYQETLILVKKQNDAVTALEIESKERARKAAIALAKAREGQGSLQAEIARLLAAVGSGKTCPEAVETVRKGLKP